MDDIVDCGVTALHPIEPKSMDFLEVRDKYSDKLAFCGGIEVDTWQEVQNMIWKI
jgi:uroporphyrinogen decarboxylase